LDNFYTPLETILSKLANKYSITLYSYQTMTDNLKRRIEEGCKKHPELLEQFIEEYVGNAFGVLPKSEIDIKCFMLLQELGVIDKTPTNFEVVRDLRVTTSKARNLIYAASLRRTDEESVKNEILELLYNPRIPNEDKDTIVIEFDNPLLADHIKHQLREWKEGTDAMLNVNGLKLTLNGYTKLVMSLLNQQLAAQSIEQTGEEFYEYYKDIKPEEAIETKIEKVIKHAYKSYKDNAGIITATIDILKAGKSLVSIFLKYAPAAAI